MVMLLALNKHIAVVFLKSNQKNRKEEKCDERKRRTGELCSPTNSQLGVKNHHHKNISTPLVKNAALLPSTKNGFFRDICKVLLK